MGSAIITNASAPHGAGMCRSAGETLDLAGIGRV
jgi:hypothetical protein